MDLKQIRSLCDLNARILTFRATRDELLSLSRPHLAWGLLWTWVVGMGRYWDNPKAHLLQHLGLGSVAYVFILAGFLWLVIQPLGPKQWSLPRLLTFITLVSAPGLLYALPVELVLSRAAARSANAWFLAIVACWRLALLFHYLKRMAQLSWPRIIIGALFPMTIIVSALTFLNLEHVVFNIMGGFSEGTANDAAYQVLIGITVLSFYAFPVLALSFLFLMIFKRPQKPSRDDDGQPPPV